MAHVTLGIGNGLVVSTWGVGLAAGAVNRDGLKMAQPQIDELNPPAESADTLVLPADCFTDTATPGRTLRYTSRPFWEYATAYA